MSKNVDVSGFHAMWGGAKFRVLCRERGGPQSSVFRLRSLVLKETDATDDWFEFLVCTFSSREKKEDGVGGAEWKRASKKDHSMEG